jgi:HAE1 family hydrophobic/amphiphilic exporter-1/multidrug efflux pump
VFENSPIDPAQVSIRTNYTGANADIIESQITEPLEKQSILLTVYEILPRQVHKEAAAITVEFNLDKDLKKLPMMLEIKRFVVYLKILMLHQ